MLFDVDGTLLDTNYLQVLAWWQALRATGHPDLTMAAVHHAVGLGSDDLVRHLLGEDAEQDTVDVVVQAHTTTFTPLRGQAVAFPGAAALIAACAHRGLVTVLATNAAAADLDWMLPALGAGSTLTGAVTSDDVTATKPAPDVLGVAIAAHDLDPARTVLIGDSVWDVAAAATAGLTCIGLTCGGISRAELLAAGATAVYTDPTELLTHLDSSPVHTQP